ANGNSSSVDLEISNWERGIYFVQITQDKHQVTKKLVVR
ncbi:MAG: T9SS type A sorting domain-containing protein, partial [Bacteroidota bacterium]